MESTSPLPDLTRVLDLGRLLEHLQTLADARHRKGRRYALAPLLLLVILAKLGGEDRPSGIADWIAHRAERLRAALRLPWARMPHHNTYRRVLETAIAPAELDRLVGEHLRGLPGAGRSDVIALDGKTVRGTITPANPHGDHLVSAYLPAEGLTLGQMATGGKDNEISVAPELVARLDLRGKVVMADALHTQRRLSRQILDAGGDYFWLVKDNQPTLSADIALLFTADDRTVEGGHLPHDFRTARQVDKGHGRREIRAITVSAALTGYSDWPGLEQVVRLERERLEITTGKQGREVVHGLTSLTPAESPPARLLKLSRAYWGIENGLHLRRDVTFREDATRLTRGAAGHVMAALNNLVIGLLRHAGATNLAAARRACDAHLTQPLSPLTACSIT